MSSAISRASRLAARVLPCCVLLAAGGCANFGPEALMQTRLQYNEVVKSTTEEQLLLNIVRLRYGDTPSSLAISAIAAQFERTQAAQLTPFFAATGDLSRGSYAAVLPQLQVGGADRPTFSLTPLDDQEFTRKLFTPLPLDGIIYLAKTTWPISTVFRLYLENLNWVSNAESASGPTPKAEPAYAAFLRGMEALQALQDRGVVVFGSEETDEALGSPLPASAVRAADLIEAAKNGYEYRSDEQGRWTLTHKVQKPVLLFDPRAANSADMQEVVRVFRLKPGTTRFAITQETLQPFVAAGQEEGLTNVDLETRSLLQALYFVAHGIDVPAEHLASGIATQTLDAGGRPFDWQRVTRGLFRVRSVQAAERPPGAHVAVQFKGWWYYIAETDADSKSTFSLLMELGRLELTGKGGPGPLLTLPLGGR
ncbi:MAG: hypothetical protein KF778_13990 [Rhodocyclaceae bacterium]|nr:hypothetical protein [Rhodocyclaceae bacterium]MBX3669505.1 hypothetical protein [Rhodocyclaceae bacterium]